MIHQIRIDMTEDEAREYRKRLLRLKKQGIPGRQVIGPILLEGLRELEKKDFKNLEKFRRVLRETSK